MDNDYHGRQGIPVAFILFVVFLIMKLNGTIDWSWWWVTLPLWILPAIAATVCLVVGAVTLVIFLFEKITDGE